MQDNTVDTETLAALVFSLLPSDSELPSVDVVLETLIECNGNAHMAASRLKSSGSCHTLNRKRKREGTLDGWLQPSINTSSSSGISGSTQQRQRVETRAPAITVRKGFQGMRAKSVDLMQVLRQPDSTKKMNANFPPLRLSTPALVAQHTPCTLHLSVLPPELACRLFYVMVDASKHWRRNKWWLFDRIVESPHKTSFFVRNNNGFGDGENWHQAARYWYNGRETDEPEVFPTEMEEACQIVETIVNRELKGRVRHSLEWRDTKWCANVAASNCYEGASESVGFHSDQLTYLGPYPTIASLSLGTSRTFRLREVIPIDERGTRQARTYNIPLPHNSLTIMHASCQETFKHSVPPQSAIDLYHPTQPRDTEETVSSSNCRINITFRFYRPDFRPESIPRCRCGVPTVLRPDMKNRVNGNDNRYWWSCYAGVQNEGKGCSFWKVLNMAEEKRGSSTRNANPEHTGPSS